MATKIEVLRRYRGFEVPGPIRHEHSFSESRCCVRGGSGQNSLDWRVAGPGCSEMRAQRHDGCYNSACACRFDDYSFGNDADGHHFGRTTDTYTGSRPLLYICSRTVCASQHSFLGMRPGGWGRGKNVCRRVRLSTSQRGRVEPSRRASRRHGPGVMTVLILGGRKRLVIHLRGRRRWPRTKGRETHHFILCRFTPQIRFDWL